MLRTIFDTNIFGSLISEEDFPELEETIISNRHFIIYGYSPIRKEIRDIPTTTEMSKKTRNALLILYDTITHDHLIGHSAEITGLAKRYYEKYRKENGTYNWNTSIKVDFMLVACATLNKLDIVWSADKKTLMSRKAITAYRCINKQENLQTPKFIDYSQLLYLLRNHLRL